MNKPVKRKRASQRGKIRGIYPRGNVFWFTHMKNGRRIQLSLGTSDYSEAVTKALEIRADPFLATADPLQSEIDAFIEHKVQQNEYSASSADSKRYALDEFAAFTNKSDPATITASDVDRFYRHVRLRDNRHFQFKAPKARNVIAWANGRCWVAIRNGER